MGGFPNALSFGFMSAQLLSSLAPKLNDNICLHGCPRFDLWFDTREDSAHYSVLYAPVIPAHRSTQDVIAEWMLKVRSEADAIGK
jgi:hypothetical protein